MSASDAGLPTCYLRFQDQTIARGCTCTMLDRFSVKPFFYVESILLTLLQKHYFKLLIFSFLSCNGLNINNLGQFSQDFFFFITYNEIKKLTRVFVPGRPFILV